MMMMMIMMMLAGDELQYSSSSSSSLRPLHLATVVVVVVEVLSVAMSLLLHVKKFFAIQLEYNGTQGVLLWWWTAVDVMMAYESDNSDI